MGNRRSADYRRYQLLLRGWLLCGAWGLAVCGLTTYTSCRNMTVFLASLLAGLLYPIYKKMDLKWEQTRQLGLQFEEAILVLASFPGAGCSLENGLVTSMIGLEGLYGKRGVITRKFTIPNAEVRISRRPGQLLMEFGSRSRLENIDNFAQILVAARRSGGEPVEIIHYMAGVIRDRVQAQEKIHTMAASRVFEQKIMDGTLFLTILYVDFISPGFFRVMYETVMGGCIVTACLAVHAGALVLAKKMLEIGVQRTKT